LTQIIVTGHGNFASGLLSALNVVVGDQPHVSAIDFLTADSSEGLKQKIRNQIDTTDGDVLVMADLPGGTPHKESVYLKLENPTRNIEVLAGSNFPMLLEATLADDETASSLATRLVDEGQSAISRYVVPAPQTTGSSDDEDGI